MGVGNIERDLGGGGGGGDMAVVMVCALSSARSSMMAAARLCFFFRGKLVAVLRDCATISKGCPLASFSTMSVSVPRVSGDTFGMQTQLAIPKLQLCLLLSISIFLSLPPPGATHTGN